MINSQPITRNIRKPGAVGNLNFCTFTQNRNGLTGWSFEIPASAYCQTLAVMLKSDTADQKRGSRKPTRVGKVKNNKK